MKKLKILSMFMLLIMLVLVGCNDKQESDNSTGGTDSGSGGSSEPEVVKVGIVLATTGPLATTGQWTLEGHQMAEKVINENGGFKVGDKEYKLKLVHYDSEGKAESATSATERLINQDKVPVIIGTSISSETAAMIPISQREQVPLVAVVAASDVLTAQGSPFFTHAAPANINYVDSGVKTMQDMGFKNIAFIYIDDAWGQSYAKLYPPKIEAAGINIVTEEAFAPDQSEFMTLLNKVKTTNPDGILLAAETELAVPFLTQLKEVMPDIKVMETGGLIPEEVLKLKPEVAEGLVALSRSGEETDDIKAFKDLFKKEFNYDANSFNFSGWDGIHLIVDAFKRAGTVTDKVKINEAIRNSEYKGLIGTYTFTENGDNNLVGNRAIIKDGKVIYQSVDTPLP